MNEVITKLDNYYHDLLELLPRLAMAILIFVIGILIANWISDRLKKRIQSKARDKLLGGFLAKSIKIVLLVIIFMVVLNIAGLSGISKAIFATAGASAVIIGFAFKDIAQNFLAGIILAFNRPFNIADTVQVEDVFGKVMEMEFRYTRIATFDGKDVYIPNSDVLTKPVYNYTQNGFFRTDFVLGIAYENDATEAKKLIQQCLDQDMELVHDEEHVNFVTEDEVASSTVNLRVYIWVETKDFMRHMLEVRGRIITKTKTFLESNGYNLPANITALKFYEASKPIKIDINNSQLNATPATNNEEKTKD